MNQLRAEELLGQAADGLVNNTCTSDSVASIDSMTSSKATPSRNFSVAARALFVHTCIEAVDHLEAGLGGFHLLVHVISGAIDFV